MTEGTVNHGVYTFTVKGVTYEAKLCGADDRVIEDVTKSIWNAQRPNLVAIAKEYKNQLHEQKNKVTVTDNGARLNAKGSFARITESQSVMAAMRPYLRSDDDGGGASASDPRAAAAAAPVPGPVDDDNDNDDDDGAGVGGAGAAGASDADSTPGGDEADADAPVSRAGERRRAARREEEARRAAPPVPPRPETFPDAAALARLEERRRAGLDAAATDGVTPPAVPSRPAPGATPTPPMGHLSQLVEDPDALEAELAKLAPGVDGVPHLEIRRASPPKQSVVQAFWTVWGRLVSGAMFERSNT